MASPQVFTNGAMPSGYNWFTSSKTVTAVTPKVITVKTVRVLPPVSDHFTAFFAVACKLSKF